MAMPSDQIEQAYDRYSWEYEQLRRQRKTDESMSYGAVKQMEFCISLAAQEPNFSTKTFNIIL